MYDQQGNLKSGYVNECSVMYQLVDLTSIQKGTAAIIDIRLRTPNEASDLNNLLTRTNHRWIPVP